MAEVSGAQTSQWMVGPSDALAQPPILTQSRLADSSLSQDVTDQVREMLGPVMVPVIPFLPQYRPCSFGDGLPSPTSLKTFRVFYAGRIEVNKGVFDLLQIARRFAAEGYTDIEFDLCGEGNELAALRKAAQRSGVLPRFRIHGHATKDFMREMHLRCHAVIASTRSSFIEGFNKVVAEGVLAGRPVVTSSVCPALEYLRGAVIEVTPDDVRAHGDALLQLRNKPDLAEIKRLGAIEARALFYDASRNWDASLRKALDLD